MRSTRKWMRGIAIAGICALITASCGGGDSTSGDGTVTLDFWTSGTAPAQKKATNKLIAEFEKSHPDINVNLQIFPFDEYFQKLSISFGANNAPDVFWVDSTLTESYGQLGVLLPLDDYLPDDAAEDFYEAPLEDMTYEGEIQSIARHQSTEGLAYLEDVMAKAGVKPPDSYEDSWTWEEFVNSMGQVVKSGQTDWGYVTQYGIGLYSAYPIIYAMGGSLFNPDEGKFVGYMDSEATTEALEKYTSLYDEKGMAPLEVLPDMLATKKVAFLQTNPFTLAYLQEQYPDLKIGMAPLPCNDECAVASGGWHIGISRATDTPDEAWEFVDALAGPEGSTTWIDITRYMPARKSAAENADWITKKPWKVLWEGLENYAVPRPRTPAYQKFADEFGKAVVDTAHGADAEAALDTAAEQIQAAHDELTE